ncbi:PadR family transcriptional regulator [Saccharothrix obliqua]|uniref:PadR family transcriptional regulator n=1 Tax=Saccharothrix obliqua TaxID=2861747 RepID=UPI001C604150|nr:PadR family transcriptional regulator [Saccharothrix obliqua]MBW4719745.1 PadR family transcriptional regulator [Saccharothrix obliqua]
MEPEGRERSLLTELRRGVVEFCVLALLDRRERYAVEVVRELAQRGLVVSEGTVYPLLSRLRGRGLVETTWRESGLGPPRRYYRLSDSGVAAVARFRREWAALSEAVDGIIATGGDQA